MKTAVQSKWLSYYRYYRDDTFTFNSEPVHKEIRTGTSEDNVDAEVWREWGWGGSDIHRAAALHLLQDTGFKRVVQFGHRHNPLRCSLLTWASARPLCQPCSG